MSGSQSADVGSACAWRRDKRSTTSACRWLSIEATQPVSTSLIQHEYGSCDSNCLQAAGWSGTVGVEAGTPFFPANSESTQSFALDAQGRPRFVFQSNPFGSGS